MRDWLGKTWDFLVQGLGGLIVRQRWVDYKKWTDFPEGKWASPEMIRTIESERYENPPHKFFWWYLRFDEVTPPPKVFWQYLNFRKFEVL